MKKILLVIMAGIGMLPVTAQNLSLAFNGVNQNRSYQAVVDGISYYSNAAVDANTSTNGTVRTITIPALQPGSHTLAVYRVRNNNTNVYNNGAGTATGRAMYTNTLQLRAGYNMLVTINGNGNVSMTEMRVRNRGGIRNQTVYTPMPAATYDALLRSTRARWTQGQRVAAVRNAFATTGNYFTTAQARELLLLVSSEGNRVTLAESAYSRITDPNNFTTLYDLFPTIASRDQLNAYIRNNPNYNNTGGYNNGGYNNGNNGTYNNGGYNNGSQGTVITNTRVPMDDVTYQTLYKQATEHLLPWNRVKEANALFTNPAYYFSVAQINQLLNGVDGVGTSQADKLNLAKLAWSRVTDPMNFNQTINLFPSQADRDALSVYVQAHPL